MEIGLGPLETLLKDLEEGVILLDADLKVTLANPAAYRLTDCEAPGELIARLESLVSPQALQLALSGVDVLNAPCLAPGKDGLPLLCSLIPLPGPGEAGLAVVIKPGRVLSTPPMESWLMWGRKYLDQVTYELHEGICYLDGRGRVIYANRAFQELCGRDFREMAGKHIASVLKVSARPFSLMEIVDRTFREGTWTGELEVEGRDGHRHLLLTSALVKGEGERVLGVAVLARDITERKGLEIEMQRRNRELGLVFDLIRLAAGYGDLEATLKESLSRILAITRSEAGGVLVVEEDGGVKVAAYQGLAYKSTRELARKELAERLYGKVLEEGRARLVDPEEEGLFVHGMRGGLRSLALAPMVFGRLRKGILVVGHKDPRHFRPQDLEALVSLASQVGIVFELAGLLDELRRGLEELGRERDFSRSLVDSMPSALVLLDEKGRISYANRRFSELLGYPLEEVKGRHLGFLFPKGQRRRAMITVMTRDRGERLLEEMAVVDAEGRERRVILTSTPRPFEAGEYRGVIVTITEMAEASPGLGGSATAT